VNEYATRYQQYQAAIKKADPTISMIAVGAPPGPLKWNGDIASLVSFDYLAASLYTFIGHPIDDFTTRIFDLDAFYKHVVGEPKSFADQLDKMVASMGDHFPIDRPSVAVTEFQSWWVSEKNDADLRLANALYLAGIYHELLRRSSKVAIAEIESLINVQGVVEVSTTSIKLTPEYFACLLYRNHIGTSVLRTVTESPAVSFNKDLSAIDSQATLSTDGKTLYLSVINRSESNDLDGVVRLHGWTPADGLPVTLLELNGTDKDAKNDFDSTKAVNIRTKSATAMGTTFEYRFPAHSVSVFEISGTR
jgi:alpha-N-arabinofuranosidase